MGSPHRYFLFVKAIGFDNTILHGKEKISSKEKGQADTPGNMCCVWEGMHLLKLSISRKNNYLW